MSIDPHVLALAEDLNLHLPLGPDDERIIDERYAIWLGRGEHPAFTVVQRLRLTTETVEPTLREVRRLLGARGRSRATWEIGSSAAPPDLLERLLGLGLRPFDEPLAVGMVFQGPASWPEARAEARRAETVEDHAAARRIFNEGFSMPPEDDDELRREAERKLERELQEGSTSATYLAFLDGEPVAAATATFTPYAVVLGGAATRASARGRGAYRALLSARLAEAERRGTPTLVVQAGALSRPILQRLGFREAAEIRILLDEFEE